MVGQVRGGSVNRLQPTGPFQENLNVGRTLADLARRANGGGASSILFLPQAGVSFDAFAFAYHTNLPKEMNIKSAPKGPLRGTLCINISGHAQGGMSDRVTGWAEHEFARVGWRTNDEVKKFQALRTACDAATRELQSDYQKTKQSVTITLDGKSVDLPRATFDKMQRASLDSDDYELQRLASYGNDALRKQFASTNTYNVRIRLPDGKTIDQSGIQRNNPDKIELATRLPIELPDGTKGQVTLEAWPTGSAGVGGYVEARQYRIHVGEGFFDVDKAIQSAEKYQQAHPEVRWDTEHESEDLERHHVSPSPYPYQDF